MQQPLAEGFRWGPVVKGAQKGAFTIASAAISR